MNKAILNNQAIELRKTVNYSSLPLDRITIEDLTDNIERIDFNHVSVCFHCGTTTKQDVTIYRPSYDEMDGHRLGWQVIFSGALDFDGNKKDMLKRYPEFKGITCDL